MFDFHEKRKIRSIVYSKVSIVLLLLLCGWLSISVYERFLVEREMAAKLEIKESELIELKERAAALEANVNHLLDERGIEAELRTQFDVIKDGEQVVVIVDDEVSTIEPLSNLESESPEKSTSFWSWLPWR